MKLNETKFMTLYEFKMLDFENQQEAVLGKNGVFISNYLDKESAYNLYAIDKFFIEIEYSIKTNEIKRIRPFLDGYLLDKYSNPFKH